MADEIQAIKDSHSEEAINAAAVHAEAIEKSRAAQIDSAIQKGLDSFFGRGVESGRFIPLTRNRMADAERFQFICDRVDGIYLKVDLLNSIAWKFIYALISLLIAILLGLGSWAFTILVHASNLK